MRSPLEISSVRFSPVRERTDGLLGFVSFRLAGAYLVDSVAVRRSANGDVVLSFPRHVDRTGVVHRYFSPLDQAARDEITEQIVAALQRMKVLP